MKDGILLIDKPAGITSHDVVGKVRRVLTYPAHKIYEVKGEREYLIPAVPKVFIESVDLDAEEIRVHLMKGLATDEN